MKTNYLNALKNDTHFNDGLTANGALTHKSTLNPVLDMFAQGGAYRKRSEADKILLFKNAYEANPTLTMKCLFYLADIRCGQGERNFFRVCFNWLCKEHPSAAKRNLQYIPEFRRWDDLIYSTFKTPLWNDAMKIVKNQLELDVQCESPSLLAKWLPSENASSAETKVVAHAVRKSLGLNPKQYRKTLSILRERINVLERLMSSNQWDRIEFSKISSRAGLIYKNAFARRDILKPRYEEFMSDKSTKVNAKDLYPHEIAHRAFYTDSSDEVNRLTLQKYWDNLPNYYGNKEENGIAVVDVSGSMSGQPMEVAVSMGAYIAEKAHGPFANHFITFSAQPELVKFEGIDIVDKFKRCVRADWGMNTDLKAVFNMLLDTAVKNHIKQEDMPERIYIFSDMQFDRCVTNGTSYYHYASQSDIDTMMEAEKKKWVRYGYKLPSVIFWNVNAAFKNNIPAIGEGFSYVSGFSPVMIETILSGKDGIDLMLEKLNSERYKMIR